MTRSLRMTEAEYAERSKRLAGWIAPRQPGINGEKRRVKKLDMGAPVKEERPKARSVGEEGLESALQEVK